MAINFTINLEGLPEDRGSSENPQDIARALEKVARALEEANRSLDRASQVSTGEGSQSTASPRPARWTRKPTPAGVQEVPDPYPGIATGDLTPQQRAERRRIQRLNAERRRRARARERRQRQRQVAQAPVTPPPVTPSEEPPVSAAVELEPQPSAPGSVSSGEELPVSQSQIPSSAVGPAAEPITSARTDVPQLRDLLRQSVTRGSEELVRDFLEQVERSQQQPISREEVSRPDEEQALALLQVLRGYILVARDTGTVSFRTARLLLFLLERLPRSQLAVYEGYIRNAIAALSRSVSVPMSQLASFGGQIRSLASAIFRGVSAPIRAVTRGILSPFFVRSAAGPVDETTVAVQLAPPASAPSGPPTSGGLPTGGGIGGVAGNVQVLRQSVQAARQQAIFRGAGGARATVAAAAPVAATGGAGGGAGVTATTAAAGAGGGAGGAGAAAAAGGASAGAVLGVIALVVSSTVALIGVMKLLEEAAKLVSNRLEELADHIQAFSPEVIEAQVNLELQRLQNQMLTASRTGRPTASALEIQAQISAIWAEMKSAAIVPALKTLEALLILLKVILDILAPFIYGMALGLTLIAELVRISAKSFEVLLKLTGITFILDKIRDMMALFFGRGEEFSEDLFEEVRRFFGIDEDDRRKRRRR